MVCKIHLFLPCQQHLNCPYKPLFSTHSISILVQQILVLFKRIKKVQSNQQHIKKEHRGSRPLRNVPPKNHIGYLFRSFSRQDQKSYIFHSHIPSNPQGSRIRLFSQSSETKNPELRRVRYVQGMVYYFLLCQLSLHAFYYIKKDLYFVLCKL